MAWELEEQESLTIARLMVASPEFVYEQIKFYGTSVDAFSGGKQKLEAALLERDEKLINLALAQFGTHDEIIQAIYDRANSAAADGEQVRYYLGLRIACLSNRHLSYFNWPDFQLNSLMAKGLTDEVRAFLTNPTIRSSVLTALYKKSECFEQVDEDSWLAMISTSAANDRVNTNNDGDDSPDLELMDIHRAIFNCLETAPVTRTSVYAMRRFLGALDPAHTRWPNEILHVLKRWGEVDLQNHNGEEAEGWLTHLSMKEELRCLIAALYSHRSTDIKDQPRYFGSSDNPDIALRCAFYAGHDLSEKEIEDGFKKDSDVFIFSVLKNYSVLCKKNKRSSIERHLSGRFMIAEYRNRCEQIHKEWPSFETIPVSEERRNLLEQAYQKNSEEISWFEKICAQNDHLVKRLASHERLAFWIVLILIAAMYFIRR